MKYSDLSINLGFHKNMQETNWLKLFPKWWAENDPLLEAIGKEIAYIKAESIFSLLNVALKPPVMIWQESLNHKDYKESFTISKKKKNYEQTLSELVKLPAPLYKTFGNINITNHTLDDINNLKISLNETDYMKDAIWRFKFSRDGFDTTRIVQYKKGPEDENIPGQNNTRRKTIPGIKFTSGNKKTACALLKMELEKFNIEIY